MTGAVQHLAVAITLALGLAACKTPAEPEPAGEGTEPAADVEAPADALMTQEKKVIEIRLPVEEGGEPVTVARYETRYIDPVLEEMRERDDAWKKEQGETTSAIKDAQEKKDELERVTKLVLETSLPEDQRPASPDGFEQVGHLPPVPQYYTGTCWSFGTTSFMEAEVIRKGGGEIKLSEMSTVYWEYRAKAERWVEERGDSLFAEGSQPNSLTRMWKEHGAWPADAYGGVQWEDGRHDHQRMVRDLNAVLSIGKKKDLWDRETILGMIDVVLDREMGAPPETFEWEGKKYTGATFMGEVLEIDPDEYAVFMSTLKEPFWKQAELDAPDNWWHDESYHNVPIDEFYGGIEGALRAGYSVVVGIDVSEPGKDAENDVMFVPAWDIPGDHIDQISRQYRIDSGVTTDDHAIHFVGIAEHAGHTWYLAKDSGRSARHGEHEGYYFVRDDFVRLKVLSYMVHRDAVGDLLAKFE